MIVKRGIWFILMGGIIFRSKLRSAIAVLCFYPFLGVVFLVGRLPLHPGLVPFRALFPLVVRALKPLTCEHRRAGEEE